MPQILDIGNHIAPGGRRGDGIETGGFVHIYPVGVDPDPEPPFLASDRQRLRGAFDRDQNVQGSLGRDRLFAFDRPEDQDLGAVEIGGDRDVVLAETRHDLFGLQGGGDETEEKGEAQHQ